MTFDVTPVDQAFYAAHLADWLPPQVIDIHTHVWLKSFVREMAEAQRGVTWPARVAAENPIADLLETYRLLLPRQTVTPLLFGMPLREVDLEQTNAYTGQVARDHRLPALLVTTPEWPRNWRTAPSSMASRDMGWTYYGGSVH